MGVLSLITIILLLLKAFGVISIPWLWVFIPIIVEAVIGLILILTVGFGATRGVSRLGR